MTLEETIKYHLDIADGQDKCADISVSEHAKERISECANNNRQLAEWLTELKEAKRLLKAAVEDINATEACDTCEYYPVINSDMCQRNDCYKWRYADEALKLIGGSENG